MNLEGTSCFSLSPERCMGPAPIWGPFVMGGVLSPHFSMLLKPFRWCGAPQHSLGAEFLEQGCSEEQHHLT